MSTAAPADPAAVHCRLVIADDQAMVRAAVRCLLETMPAIEVVAEARDGEEAVRKISELAPDVALVDLIMPKMSGIEVIRRVAGSGSRTRMVALSALTDTDHVRDVLSAGAAGYVPKAAASAELIEAIRAVIQGRHYVHASVVNELIISSSGRKSPALPRPASARPRYCAPLPWGTLTRRSPDS